METMQGELELVQYSHDKNITEFNLDPTNQTVWANQAQMAELFGVDRSAISQLLDNIYSDEELDKESTCARFTSTQREGGRDVVRHVDHYNLDAVLSVGYRVSSKRATEFRRWATTILRDYIVQGFALNESRLKDDPNALQKLAFHVRKLRADEKNIYQAVRDVFKDGSCDYNKNSPLTRSFYAKLQDKFMFAITGHTASEIILNRADHKKNNMGLENVKGKRPTVAEVKIGKNYLASNELYALHILCEQFLLFVESKAVRGQKLTMSDMSLKFDKLLEVQGHSVFKEYKDFLKVNAHTHAERELKAYKQRLKLEQSLA